ncbi:class A beta-lactamase [Saccharopolyspora sp. ASAGF58]|uniref:class A beta-lactamase n=1 Tax=Saccharopolyspora sp. ASAGF58 TaxID=2719023 RepID=UPI00143FCA02|nr:class A beta-lactamase [Saccharopolyspora sp. ASAGF58]QIZ39724.1 class A beta-lactamase [Saccharopolyspora sp. ASAGF58]
MQHNETRVGRRSILGAFLAAPVAAACGASGVAAAPSGAGPALNGKYAPAFADLERRYDARLGLFAVNVHTGQFLGHRAGERFAMCSTFKTYAAAALLREHGLDSGYFDKMIHYTEADLVDGSPITKPNAGTGMMVHELCAAAITRSDNTAANLLLAELGGPATIAPFARSIGDGSTRLDRWEPDLNMAIPGDERDTTTPAGIAAGYRALVVGDALRGPEHDRLTGWLFANTTGGKRIRAGLPPTWRTGDKTGTGDYASGNDVAVTWTDKGHPIVIAVLTSRPRKGDEVNNGLHVDTARVVAEALG